MEREKFEGSWKDAFDKAEVSPSDGVWTNIELDLEKEKGGHLKRRLMFYQIVAAASVVFAMAIGGIGYYINFKANQNSAKKLALETAQSPETLASQPDEPGTTNDTSSPDPDGFDALATPAAKNDVRKAAKENNERDRLATALQRRARRADGANMIGNPKADGAVFAISDEADVFPATPHKIHYRELPPLYTPRKIALNISPEKGPEVDPVQAMLAQLEQLERELRGEEKEKEARSDENLWTSVGFAAGSFNSIQTHASSPSRGNYSTLMALAAPILDKETKASGYAYSMGVNVGTRISERWVLQGGINYMSHSSEYTANNVVVSSTLPKHQQFRAATPNELVNADAQELSSKLVYSAPYNVTNSMQYLSIPVQAGYLLINKTFGLQLNAGVATDLFLQNTIEADSYQLDKTSQASGSDSPYRSVNLSGLLGTEFSYRLSENYRISLNPGIRYPFNTIYKSELGVQSTPLTFDIGLRFRYIFH